MADDTSQSTKSIPLAIRSLVYNLLFTWGFVTVLNDPLVAKLKALFSLSYTEAMLIPFAFFASYFIFSISACAILNRFGHVMAMVIGLALMALGCFLILLAARSGLFPGFLVALLCISAGMAITQFAADPFMTTAGSANVVARTHTLAQVSNSLGTFLAPIFGALYFLSDGLSPPAGMSAEALHAARVAGAEPLVDVYLVVALLLFFLALLLWTVRNVKALEFGIPRVNPFWRGLWRKPQLMLGVVCMFLYVGAEVSIGAGLTNYLMQPSVIGHEAATLGAALARWLARFVGRGIAINAAQTAGAMVSIYWGLAMVGRFFESTILVRASPGKLLAFNALVAASLTLVSASTSGVTAATAVLAVGLANSILFPTIHTLALADLGDDRPKGHALLMTGLAGGAIVPMIYGALADSRDLAFALLVPAACYVVIAGYGWLMTRGFGATRASAEGG